MSSLDLDFDTQMDDLEREWQRVYEASIAARAEYQALAAARNAKAAALDAAHERLDRAEDLKVRIMSKIERFEERLAQGGLNDSGIRHVNRA
jgi:hypothetical protein